jgi:hypothetical protein
MTMHEKPTARDRIAQLIMDLPVGKHAVIVEKYGFGMAILYPEGATVIRNGDRLYYIIPALDPEQTKYSST